MWLTYWVWVCWQVHEKDAQALLDALFSRLGTQSTQAAERDLCARALQESFVWAVRQASKTELSRHPGSGWSLVSIVDVFITFICLSLHIADTQAR